jgi:hypothetical protein
VRGDWHIQSPIAPRFRETTLVLDVMEIFGAEFLDRRDHRADGRVAEGA